MPNHQDTEITLGTGKLLALFFALVAVCALFFGAGYKLGKASNPVAADTAEPATTVTGSPRPSAVKPSKPADVAFSKSAGQDTGDAQAAPLGKTSDNGSAEAPPAAAENPAPSESSGPAASNGGYYVQVAAVSKQEDADALVDALKKKQYTAFSGSQAGDKLFHVQVGPFADIKEADGVRAKLVSDGYNPIVKK